MDEMGCEVTDDVMVSICSMNQNIFHVTEAGMRHMRELTNLKALNISSFLKITVHGLEHIVALPFKELCISNSNLDDSHIKVIAKIKSLQKLDVSDNFFTNVGLACLSSLTQLTWLNLNACPNITPAGLKPLINLPLEALFVRPASSSRDTGYVLDISGIILPCMHKLRVLQFDTYTLVRKQIGTPFDRYETNRMVGVYTLVDNLPAICSPYL